MCKSRDLLPAAGAGNGEAVPFPQAAGHTSATARPPKLTLSGTVHPWAFARTLTVVTTRDRVACRTTVGALRLWRCVTGFGA